jgi:hypothetical protein
MMTTADGGLEARNKKFDRATDHSPRVRSGTCEVLCIPTEEEERSRHGFVIHWAALGQRKLWLWCLLDRRKVQPGLERSYGGPEPVLKFFLRPDLQLGTAWLTAILGGQNVIPQFQKDVK